MKPNDILGQLKVANSTRRKRFGNSDQDWSLPELGNAIAGEVGELCNVIKKIHRGDFDIKTAEEKHLLSHEIADVVIYLDVLCQTAGLDLGTCIVNKYNETSDKLGFPEKLAHVG